MKLDFLQWIILIYRETCQSDHRQHRLATDLAAVLHRDVDGHPSSRNPRVAVGLVHADVLQRQLQVLRGLALAAFKAQVAAESKTGLAVSRVTSREPRLALISK